MRLAQDLAFLVVRGGLVIALLLGLAWPFYEAYWAADISFAGALVGYTFVLILVNVLVAAHNLRQARRRAQVTENQGSTNDSAR